MPKQKYNTKLLSTLQSYKIEDICNIFKNTKLNHQTVRKWLKKEGLKTITTYPYLINGKDLKSFLENKNNKHKQKLTFNKFACFACKKHVVPKSNAIQAKTDNKVIKTSGICSNCNKQINKIYSLKKLNELKKHFFINQAETTLCNTLSLKLKTHIIPSKSEPKIESLNSCKDDRQSKAKQAVINKPKNNSGLNQGAKANNSTHEFSNALKQQSISNNKLKQTKNPTNLEFDF